MRDVNEVPTYRPPAGVNGPTLGRDLLEVLRRDGDQ
jgi:hypothetical protein